MHCLADSRSCLKDKQVLDQNVQVVILHKILYDRLVFPLLCLLLCLQVCQNVETQRQQKFTRSQSVNLQARWHLALKLLA